MGEVRNMRGKTTRSHIGILLALFIFVSIAVNSSAAIYYFPTAGSYVNVFTDTTGEMLGYFPAPEIPHDINSGDHVYIRFNCYWNDTRPALQKNGATFNFTLTAIHSLTTYSQSYEITTYGATSGSTQLAVLVLSVNEYDTINITYSTVAWVAGIGNWNDAHVFSADYSFI